MIYIDEATSNKLISHQLAYTAIKKALIAATGNEACLFPVVNAAGTAEGSMFSLKSACTPQLVGWKTGTYWPDNINKGLPCHDTTIFLLCPDTGHLKAAIAAGQVNAYRTAAADAIAVDTLARADASTLTVFGTGHQARYEVEAVCQVRPIKRIIVVGRSQDKSDQFINHLATKGLIAQIGDAQAACQAADIIITATTACAPLFDAEWVQPGTHISAMGADKVGKNELPKQLYKSAKLFCDYPQQSVVIGEFQHAQDPQLTAIGTVISGAAEGRISNTEITIFDSSGIAIQDLYIANEILRLTKEILQN